MIVNIFEEGTNIWSYLLELVSILHNNLSIYSD